MKFQVDKWQDRIFTNPKTALIQACEIEASIKIDGQEILSVDIIRAIANERIFNGNNKPFIEALEILRDERKFK